MSFMGNELRTGLPFINLFPVQHDYYGILKGYLKPTMLHLKLLRTRYGRFFFKKKHIVHLRVRTIEVNNIIAVPRERSFSFSCRTRKTRLTFSSRTDRLYGDVLFPTTAHSPSWPFSCGCCCLDNSLERGSTPPTHTRLRLSSTDRYRWVGSD